MWDVAETVFGDGSRVGELLELNPHIGSARQLRPGQIIHMPVGAAVPESRRAAAAHAVAAAIDEAESVAESHVATMSFASSSGETSVASQGQNATWSQHVVTRGESVYAIAAELTGGDDRRLVDVADQIIARNLGRTMPDGRIFSDPSLILPGWRLDVPVVSSEPGADATTSPDAAGATVAHVVTPGESYWEITEIICAAPAASRMPLLSSTCRRRCAT
jgi:LysM repeat protein